MENGIQTTSVTSQEKISLGQTAGLLELPARTSLSQDSEKVSTETGAPLSERFSEFLEKSGSKIDPNGLSTKMLRECLAAIEAGTSLQLFLKWNSSGMISNGSCSTQKTSEFPRTENECILLDILEPEVNVKYFLSEQQAKKIVFGK